MSTLEELARRCITATEVSKLLPVQRIEEVIITHLRGRREHKYEEIPGIEIDPEQTRYVFLLDSESDAETLYDNIREEDVLFENQSYKVVFDKTIACEVPLDWREDSDEDDLEMDGDKADDMTNKPPVPKRPRQMHMSPNSDVPMASGFYQNLPASSQGQPAEGHYQSPHMSPYQQPPQPQQPQAHIPQLLFQEANSGQIISCNIDQQDGSAFFVDTTGKKVMIVCDQTGRPMYHNPESQEPVLLWQLPPMQPPQPYREPIYDVPQQGPPPPYSSPQQSTYQGSRATQDQEDIYQKLQKKAQEDDSRMASDEASSSFSAAAAQFTDDTYATPRARPQVFTQATHIKVSQIPSGIHEEFLFMTFKTVVKDNVKVTQSTDGTTAILDVYTSEAANKILQHGPFVVKNQEMFVEEFFPQPEVPNDNNTVQVIGNVSKEQVEMYFENKKRSGGGDIKNTDEIETGVFWITFEEEEAVQRVLDKSHKIGKTELEVCRSADVAPAPAPAPSGEEADQEPSCIIIVSGVSCIDSIDTVEMYFESKKRSGGGEIVDLVKDERDVDIIYITFEDHEVVQRILSKSHKINDCELTVRLFEPTKPTAESEGSEEPGPVCTVVVKGASRVGNRDMLEMYFESKKRSGGGDIEEIHTDDEDEDIVYISFTDESVAKEVAVRSHTVNSETLEVSLYIPPVEVLEPAGPVKTICVRMVTPVSADLLEMYFESKKRSGGGVVECVEIDQDDPCIAYVTFEEEEVAETVSTKTHVINGDDVEVSLYQPACSKQVPGCTIKVSGVDQFKTTDPLEMYFENRKRSGGDDVVEIKRDPYNFDIVYVTFETNDVVTSVLKRSRHRVNEQTLRVEAYVPSQQPKKGTKQTTKDQKQKKDEEMEEEEKPVCSVRVTGVSKISSQDAVVYYFENNRRSGGGEIDKSWKDEENPDLLFITYKSAEVAKAVSEKSSHSVDGKELKASLYRPPKPLPTYTDRVLIKGLSPATTQDCLFNYLEAKIQAVPVKSVYGAIEGVVMVTFQENPDFSKFDTINGKPLEKSILTISPVTVSNCIYVTNLPENCSRDTLMYYFENHRRSSGGDVDKLVMVTEENAALVYFTDYLTVEDVLNQQEHTVGNQRIGVHLYVECLGRTEGDGTEPAFKVPNPVYLKSLDNQKLKFLKKSPVNKTAIEKQLEGCQAKIHWYDDKPDVHLECLLTKDVKDCRKLAKNWKKIAEDSFNDFFDKIKLRKLPATETTWDGVIKLVQTLSIANSESLAVVVDKEQHMFSVVGIGPHVSEVADKIHGCIKSVEEEIERQKSMVKETVTNLKPIHTKMLLANKFPVKIKDKFPNLKVVINQNRNELVFEGANSEVRDGKMEMHENVNLFELEVLHDLPKVGVQLYNEKTVKEYIIKELKGRKMVAVWEVSQVNSRMTICAPSRDTIGECLEMIRDAVKERQFQLTKDSRNVVQSQDWINQVEQWKSQFPGRVLIQVVDLDKVFVCATDDLIDQIAGAVENFIGKNTIVTETLSLPTSTVQLIERHEKDEVDNISKKLIGQNVQITCQSGNSGYTIRGTSEGVAKAKKDLKSLASRVKKEEHTINKPGIGVHMKTSKGMQTLSQVEKEFPVVIRPKDSDEDEEEIYEEPGGSGLSGSNDSGLIIHAKCSAYDDRKVYAAEGDMSESNVDVLVNTADEKLSLNGGLGRVIVKKGGKSIERACQQYISDQGKLTEGETFISSAGNLKAKYIVHVVGPKWNGGQSNEEEILEETVMKAMQQASAKNAHSVAMPAISCGVLGYPVKQATAIIVKAVKNFFREMQDTTIQEVYLCDIKTENVERFTTALGVEFGSHNVTLLTREERRKPSQHRGKSMPNDGRRPPGATADPVLPSMPPPRRKTVDKDSVQIGHVTISVVKGQIAGQRVDVIVNTTARNLDLKNGAVSTSLSKAAGPGMQEEARKKYPRGLKDGELAQTRGHKLHCQYVLHGTLMNWDGGAAAKGALHHLVTSTLEAADKLGMESIALPAIGTGNLGFPRDVVAKEMFRMATKFSQKNPNSSIQDVRFIVYEKDVETIKAFEREAGSLDSGDRRNVPSRQSGNYANLNRDSDAEEENIYEEITDVKRSMDDAKGASPYMVSDIQVSVRKADLTEEDCDCIVNSSNAELDLTKGAVAKALLAKCGNELKKEAEKKSKMMARHQFVVTSAPRLNCRNIMHIVAQDSSSSWRSMVDMVLQEAEKNKFTSIAFPALGTGLQMKAKDIARVMFKSIQEFQTTQPMYLKDIRFVIFQQSMVDDFCNAIEEQSGKKPNKGKLGAIWSSFWVDGKGAVSGSGKKTDKPTGQGRPDSGMSGEGVDEITVIIYAMKTDVIRKAIKMLNELLEKETMRKEFTDSVIMRMDQEMTREIKALAKQHHVQIDVTRAKGRIVITGLPQHVMTVNDKIYTHMRSIEQQESIKEKAHLLSNIVQWFYIEVSETGRTLEQYEATVNHLIEDAYKQQAANVRFKDKDGNEYEIDFANMVEYEVTSPKDTVGVIRRDLLKEGTFDPPTTWKQMNSNLLVVQLQPTDPEYKTVHTTFIQSAQQQLNVTRIDRIQNKTLWQQYQAKKKQLESQNKKGTQNEKTLWHGTAVEGVDSINTHGFNRSYCGKNAVYYGDGVYFAIRAAYSCIDTYSRPDSNKIKRMYSCRVLTGEVGQGKQGMRVPPIRDKTTQTMYDSVVDNLKNPNMHIIFHDTQAYPEYLIYFRS